MKKLKSVNGYAIFLLMIMCSHEAAAEVIKLKCTGVNEYSGKKQVSVYLINTSVGTVNSEHYAILDVNEKMITWQRKIADDPGEQLPLVEINRQTGVEHLTWSSGDTSDRTSCQEF